MVEWKTNVLHASMSVVWNLVQRHPVVLDRLRKHSLFEIDVTDVHLQPTYQPHHTLLSSLVFQSKILKMLSVKASSQHTNTCIPMGVLTVQFMSCE